MKDKILEFLKKDNDKTIKRQSDIAYLATMRSLQAQTNCTVIIIICIGIYIAIFSAINRTDISLNEMFTRKDINFMILSMTTVVLLIVIILRQTYFKKQACYKVTKTFYYDLKYYSYQIYINREYYEIPEFIKDRISKEDVFLALRGCFNNVEFNDVKKMKYSQTKNSDILTLTIKYKYNNRIIKKKRKLSNKDYRSIFERNFDSWHSKTRESYKEEEILNSITLKSDYNFFIKNFIIYITTGVVTLICMSLFDVNIYRVSCLLIIIISLIYALVTLMWIRRYKKWLNN